MKMLQRMTGTILFRPAVYRDIAENGSRWGESAVIVGVLAAAVCLLQIRLHGFTPRDLLILIGPFLNLYLLGRFSAAALKGFYKSDVSLANLLKIFGYAYIFAGVPALILILPAAAASPILKWLLTVLTWLTFAALILGIREAGRTSTGHALIAFLFSLLITGVILYIVNIAFGVLI